MVILNKSNKTKKESKMNKEQMKKLIESTKKESKKNNARNQMTSSVNVDMACEILVSNPNGLSPQMLAELLTEKVGSKEGLVNTPKQVRKSFQNLNLKKGLESDIVIDKGNFAYVVSLRKNGNKNIYKAIKKS